MKFYLYLWNFHKFQMLWEIGESKKEFQIIYKVGSWWNQELNAWTLILNMH
jgi:hypothetical protein